MKYQIWDPFEEIKKLRKEMDKVFRRFGKISVPKGLKIRESLVDIINKKDKIEIKAELPGVDKKDIKISVKEGKVEIKAEKKSEKEEKKKDFYRKERSYRGFYKAFSLPALVDPAKAKSSFKDGMLMLTLPKSKKLPEKKKPLSLK